MKIKFYVVLLLSLIFSVYFVFYKKEVVKYSFLHEESMIKSIDVVTVKVNKFDSNDIDIYIECSIIDVEDFLVKFHELECIRNNYAPFGLHENSEYIFKIDYKNGEYELIESAGIAKYSLDYGMQNYQGKYIFDYEMFNELVNLYLNDRSSCSLP